MYSPDKLRPSNMDLQGQLEHQQAEEEFRAMIRTIDEGRKLEFGSTTDSRRRPQPQSPRNWTYAAFDPNANISFEAREAQRKIWDSDFIQQSPPWPIVQTPSSRSSTPATVRPQKASTTIYMHVALRKSCTFCPNVGASYLFSTSHRIRNLEGTVTCPVLRAYNCKLCNNGGGDEAHTERYCPTLKNPKKPKLVHKIRRGPRSFQ